MKGYEAAQAAYDARSPRYSSSYEGTCPECDGTTTRYEEDCDEDGKVIVPLPCDYCERWYCVSCEQYASEDSATMFEDGAVCDDCHPCSACGWPYSEMQNVGRNKARLCDDCHEEALERLDEMRADYAREDDDD